MATFDSRKDELVIKHIENLIERSVSRLVNNQAMADNETNFHRGYIAACREFAVFYTKDLTIKLNEG